MTIDWSDVKDHEMHTECIKALNGSWDNGKICHLCLKKFYYEMSDEFRKSSVTDNSILSATEGLQSSNGMRRLGGVDGVGSAHLEDRNTPCLVPSASS